MNDNEECDLIVEFACTCVSCTHTDVCSQYDVTVYESQLLLVAPSHLLLL